MLKKYLQFFLINSIPACLVFLGTLSWMGTMVRNGLNYSYGMGFWGANAHDGLWHIALAESFKRGYWNIPMFAGEFIKNYHIGFDLLLSILSKITFIPVANLYFQVFPPILALLVGFTAYRFVYAWSKSNSVSIWSLFFIYFGGSFGWIVTLFRGEGLTGESMFWSMQSISTVVNPPFALSLILIFSGLYYLVLGLENNNKKYFAYATFCFGLLAIVKIYASVLILAGLFVVAGIRLVKNLKIDLYKVFSGVLILTLLILAGQSNNYGGTFIFKPFWFLETMMSAHDRLYWPRFADAMINYKLAGSWLKMIVAYTAAYGILIVGNVGTRIVGGWWLATNLAKKNKDTNYRLIDLLLVIIIVLGFLVPMLFVQKGTTWNTIQFFYYSLFILGIYTGIAFGNFLEKLKTNFILRYSVAFVMVLLTIPTTIGTLQFYLSKTPSAVVSGEELDALQFLRGQPEGVVLTIPYEHKNELVNGYQPLYSYESTAYVSAIANKETYFEDYINLEITGYNWRKRLEEENVFFEHPDNDFLIAHKISYLFLLKNYLPNNIDKTGFSRIFENGSVIIYGL